MNHVVRKTVRDLVRRRSRVVYSATSRQKVSVVILSAKIGKQTHEALGTAKWHPDDIFSHTKGCEIAYERALSELTDKFMGLVKNNNSVLVLPEFFIKESK